MAVPRAPLAEQRATHAGRGAGARHLTDGELAVAQDETLATPRRNYGPAARVLFELMDVVYGRTRTLSKFKVLEIVARVPYQAWEQVAYIAITHVFDRTALARRIHDRVNESRAQQDNEQWHLLILEELILRSGQREDVLRLWILPQVIAFLYYQLSWLLYVLHPTWSYALNADFEDHAEHEYMAFVREHSEFDSQPFDSSFADDYGRFASLADLFRQIGCDERAHKLESLARMAEPRFR
jgi:ubiquinol oxidase